MKHIHKIFFLTAWLTVFMSMPLLAARAPELPGTEVDESETALKKSEQLTQAVQFKAKAKEGGSWQAPPIENQLARDKTLIGLGYGALFLPTYTESRLEPEISVFDKPDHIIERGMHSERMLLEKGRYEIRIGSGTMENKMKYFVTIEEGHTTVVPPKWAGLIVETLDNNENYINAEYEIFRMDNSQPYGKGYGLEEERLKDTKTWILPPGLYKITRVGQDFTLLNNYITVQLNPGMLSQVELIYDSETLDIISGGLKNQQESKSKDSFWKYGLRIGGNVSFNTKITDGKEQESGTNALLDFRARAIYDRSKYHGTNVFQIKNNFQKQKGDSWAVVSDDLEMRSTWIRRLNNFIGPYLKGIVTTKLWPGYLTVDPAKPIVIQSETGDTLRMLPEYRIDTIINADTTIIKNVLISDKFKTSPSLYPLTFGEGIGVNLEFLSFYMFSFSTQIGAAARQIIVQDQLVNINNTNKYEPEKTQTKLGIENTYIARIRLGTRLTVDLLADILFPIIDTSDPAATVDPKDAVTNMELERFIVDTRIGLTRNLELSYLYEIEDNYKDHGRNSPKRFLHDHTFLLRISINF